MSIKINVLVDDKGHKRIISLLARTKANDVQDLIRFAFATYDTLVDKVESGGQIICRGSDGEEHVLILPGVSE